MEPIISIRNYSKTLKKSTVLQDIQLEIGKQEICGLVGKNGSGKTMLLRAICGFIRPDQGEIWVEGIPIHEQANYPANAGILIEYPGFIDSYSGLQNLRYLAAIRNRITEREIRQAIHEVGLDPSDSRPVKRYSLGMRQRLGIAQAIMEKPSILLLDEPTNGLDSDGVQLVKNLMISLQKSGVTIVVATHHTEELGDIFTKEVRIENGRIIKNESLRDHYKPQSSLNTRYHLHR